jgi:hypothetical protein
MKAICDLEAEIDRDLILGEPDQSSSNIALKITALRGKLPALDTFVSGDQP